MTLFAVEGAPLAAEHALAHLAVVVAIAVKALLGAIIVDARHPLTAEQVADRQYRLFVKWSRFRKRRQGRDHGTTVL